MMFEVALGASDVRRIAAADKLAAIIAIEGGHAIGDDLRVLRQYFDLGVRYMSLTHFNTHDWADSATDVARHNGLSAFGRDVVAEMNRIGMMVDVSHASDNVFWDVIEMTEAPVMASHSSMRALVDHPRNMTDDMLRAVAGNGGIVCVDGMARVHFHGNYWRGLEVVADRRSGRDAGANRRQSASGHDIGDLRFDGDGEWRPDQELQRVD